MGRVIYHPMMVDWSNREAVIEYARSFGPQHALTVVKLPNRANYNIIRTKREDELEKGSEIFFRTQGVA